MLTYYYCSKYVNERPFKIAKLQTFLPLHIPQLVKSLLLNIPEALRVEPLRNCQFLHSNMFRYLLIR